MRAGTHAHARARVRITARAAVLLVVVMLLAIALVYPARLYVRQRGQIGELEKQTQILTVANQNLAGQVQRLNDPAYQEKLARECLGMVKPGETAFVVVQRGGDPEPAAC
jgi:cell division protein FtsB